MAVLDRAATSQTIAQKIQSGTHHPVPACSIRRRLQQIGMSAKRPSLHLLLSGNKRRLCHQWCVERWTWTIERNDVVFADVNPTSVYSITMVRFEFGDIVVRGC
ncbi:transposable element Tcb1 transposase [Trichonephila clavipes]|nr:transposable element Tcb1 transposase [Trichonephila clavipes]